MQCFDKNQHEHTPYFCEENIWLLGKSLLAAQIPAESLRVLILSNARQQIPLFNQTQSAPNVPIFWDYHVILLHETPLGELLIFDFDTRLPFPSPLRDYAQQTFPPHEKLPKAFQIFIRIIPLKVYHRHFHSTRAHMLDPQGRPLCPFPPHAPIVVAQEKERIPLSDYLDFSKNLWDGSQVHSHEGFLHRFLARPSVKSSEKPHSARPSP